MLNLFQRWIRAKGPLPAAVAFSLIIGAGLAVAANLAVLAFHKVNMIDHLPHGGEVVAIAVAAFAVALVIALPSFALISDLQSKETNLESLVEELRDTQERLRTSEARFRHVAEAASDWIWEMDADLRFSYFSPRTAEVVGVPVEFHIGKTRAELAGEDVHTEKWQRHLDDLANHRQFRDFRFVRKGHDGRLQTLTASGKPLFDANGEFAGYIGVGTDLTPQLEAEESARLAQERLAAAIEQSWGLFVLWDPDDRLVICNEEFREINAPVIDSTTPGTLFADHIRAVMDAGLYPADSADKESWLAERFARHESPGEAFEIERRDGHWLLIREQRFPDGSTSTVGIDITERKQAEAQLIAAKERAEAANRSKSDFLARMSHELRTPLNAILGFSQIIRDEAFGPIGVPVYADYAKDINASGEMLLSLINDLLDLSRIEAGKFELTDSVIDMRAAAGDVLRLFEREAAASRLGIDLAVSPSLPALRADTRAVRQVLMNLISNAVKFTRSGGKIKVGADITAEGLVVTVADTGIGFPPSKIETVLAPFGRLDQAETATAGGTGLGLPIVKSLMELHGGAIALKSEPGVGTTVTLTFPTDRIIEAELQAAEAD